VHDSTPPAIVAAGQSQQIEIHVQHGHPESKQAEAPHDCQHVQGAADVTALQEMEGKPDW
jgi:hypothetical protein